MPREAMRIRAGLLPIVLALLAAACSSSDPSVTKHDAASTTTTSVQPRKAACDSAGTAAIVRHLPSTSGSVWVWIESASRSSFRAGRLVKIVWRITGRGRPRVLLSNPNGRAERLTFGPEEHARSTFRHPGAEYGTGFVPSAPGCWRMTMQRGDVSASLSFPVA